MRGDPARHQMSRKHGQELRTDVNGPSFKSLVSRQAYWASRLATTVVDSEERLSDNLAVLGHAELKDLTEFEQANISTATLTSPPAPYGNEEPAIAGISQQGIAPPPPPR